MKKLTGSAGTGSKIMQNLSIFNYKIDKENSSGDFYAFNVSFGNQKGFLNFRKDGDHIKNVNLSVDGFPKTLGSNNDSSLISVATMIYNSL